MANHALATLETALRARKLDRTLTTALPPLDRIDPGAMVPTDVDALDAALRGGLPRSAASSASTSVGTIAPGSIRSSGGNAVVSVRSSLRARRAVSRVASA